MLVFHFALNDSEVIDQDGCGENLSITVQL